METNAKTFSSISKNLNQVSPSWNLISKVFLEPLKFFTHFYNIWTVYLRLNKLQPNTMFHNFGMDTEIHRKFSHHIQNMSQDHMHV